VLSLLWRGVPQASVTPLRIFATGMLVFIAADVTYLLLTVVGLQHLDFDSLGGVLLGAVLLTCLVSARQFAALRDYGRLAVRYQQLASIDGMTGLYNRRHFMEVAEGTFAHAQRLGQPLFALMIDVDHFKQINDVHGHAVGDRVLTGPPASPAATGTRSRSPSAWGSRNAGRAGTFRPCSPARTGPCTRPSGPAEDAGGSTRTLSRRPIPPLLNPGPGAAAGPASAVPPAWAERQVPNGRARGPDPR
jgi:hypothetical protein